MKNLLNLATAFVALAGWSGVFALDLPELCGDYQLLNSPDTRVYHGQFTSNGVSLEHALIVIEVTDTGRALVFYAHGRQPAWDIDRANCRPHFGTMEENTLTVHLYRGNTVTYVFDESGKVSVVYVVRRRSGGTRRTRGELMRVE